MLNLLKPHCNSNSMKIWFSLTHLPLMPHICVCEWGQHWFIWWLVDYPAPSHCLNQCRIIVNWILRNKLQWNCNQNKTLVIQEKASENIVCEMAAIKSRGNELIRSQTIYRKISNIRGTLQGNKIVDHSDVVGASPAGAAPTTSSFSI